MRNAKIVILIIFIPLCIFGQNWKQINSPSNNNYRVVFKTNKIGWVLGSDFSIYHTSDGGTTWEKQRENANNLIRKIYFSDTLNGWCVGESGVILNTKDGGKTWKIQRIDVSLSLISVFSIKSTTWIAGFAASLERLLYGIIFKTTNSGETWVKMSDTTIRGLYDICFIDENEGWAAGFMEISDIGGKSYLIHTTDGGNSWKEQKLPLGGDLYHVSFYNNKIGWASGWNGPLLKTTDGGENWIALYYGSTYRSQVILDTNEIWTSEGNRIHHTKDGGNSWKTDTFPVNTNISDLSFPDKKTGFAVSNDERIWMYTEKTVGVKERENINLNNILYNNYPNPANPTTKIDYYIARESDVKIVIYDILGREILLLINERKKLGFYSIEFNGEKYSSGIYFYKMTTNNFTQTKKLFLLK